jgi:hypothetical protein
MNINGNVYPLLEKTGHLTPAVKNKIKHQPASKWIKVLEHDPHGISSLFHAIFLVPGWEKNRDLLSLKEKILKAQPKNKYIAPTHGIANRCNASYITSILQLFRTTHFFDSILQENGAIRVNNFLGSKFHDIPQCESRLKKGDHDVAKNTLIKLRKALREAVIQIRNKAPLAKGTLENIKSLFEKLKGFYYYLFPDSALDFLEDSLGNVEPFQIVTKNTFSDDKKHTFTQEKQERPTNLDLDDIFFCMPTGPSQDAHFSLTRATSSQARFQEYFQQPHLVACDHFVDPERNDWVNFVALERDQKTHAVVRVLSDNELKSLVSVALGHLNIWLHPMVGPGIVGNMDLKKALGLKRVQEYMKAQSHYFQFLSLVKKECTLQTLPHHIELNISSSEHSISINLDLSHNLPQALRAKPHNPKYTLQSAICGAGPEDKYVFFLRDLASGLWTRYEDDKVTRGLKWEQAEAELRHKHCRLFYIPTPQVAPKKSVVPAKKPHVPSKAVAPKPAVVKPKAVTPKPSAKKTPNHKPNSKKH